MTPDERQMLADLFERIRSTANGSRDPQAEAFINDAVRGQPYSPYVMAQTVLVQQHALEEAAKRISELEAGANQPPPQETSFLGNIGRSLFGGGSSQPPAQPRSGGYDASAYQRSTPPPPQGYAPQQQSYAAPPQQGYAPQAASPWGAAPSAAPAGGGFLSSALRTATGVAGGLLVGNALENMLGGRGGMFGGGGLGGGLGAGGFGGAGYAPQETVNNFYENAPDPAGQHAEDVLQDQDQDQDDAQDASYDDGGFDSGSDDSI